MNPVDAHPSCFFKIHFNIILLRHGFPSGLFLSNFHRRTPVFLFSPTRVTCSAHPVFIIFRQEYLMWYSALYRFWSLSFFARLRFKLFSSTLLSNLCPYLTVSDQVSHPCKATGKVVLLGIVTSACQANHSGPNSSRHSLDLSVLFLFVYGQNANKWKLCSLRYEVRITSKCKKCLLPSVQNWSFCLCLKT